MGDFFETWSKLYANSPAEYELRRSQEIEQLIESAPLEKQQMLRQLQWKLDAIHHTRPPLKATIEMSELMWKSFEKMRTQLNAVVNTANIAPSSKPKLTIIKE